MYYQKLKKKFNYRNNNINISTTILCIRCELNQL